MKNFKVEHLPILAEYVITGVTLSLASTLDNDDAIDEFFEWIKESCLKQGFLESTTDEALKPLESALRLVVREKS